MKPDFWKKNRRYILPLVFQNYDTGRIALLDMETGERTQTPLNSESARFTGGTLYGLHEGSLYS